MINSGFLNHHRLSQGTKKTSWIPFISFKWLQWVNEILQKWKPKAKKIFPNYNGQQDISQSYCWWFRIPNNHLGCIRPYKSWDKLLHQLVSQISEPSTVNKWLITMVIVSPLNGVIPLINLVFLWLGTRGDPNWDDRCYLTSTCWVLHCACKDSRSKSSRLLGIDLWSREALHWLFGIGDDNTNMDSYTMLYHF